MVPTGASTMRACRRNRAFAASSSPERPGKTASQANSSSVCCMGGRELPGAHPTDIHVDEVGGRIVTDPAAAQGDGSTAHIGQIAAGDAYIDGQTLHMQAVLGNTTA